MNLRAQLESRMDRHAQREQTHTHVKARYGCRLPRRSWPAGPPRRRWRRCRRPWRSRPLTGRRCGPTRTRLCSPTSRRGRGRGTGKDGFFKLAQSWRIYRTSFNSHPPFHGSRFKTQNFQRLWAVYYITERKQITERQTVVLSDSNNVAFMK